MPPPSGWYQQNMTGLSGRSITDMTFTDSLTGYAVTKWGADSTGFILKTTNGGDNWNIILSAHKYFRRVIFINDNTGFVCGGWGELTGYLYKTTNAGLNWFTINTPFGKSFNDMSVLNEDTIYIADDMDYWGGVFRTTNGGQTWQTIFNAGTINNPSKIYMYNKDIGFICRTGTSFFKTTNGGINWFQITGYGEFFDIYFADSLTGWKCPGIMQKTTDGGYNWITQVLPSGYPIASTGISNFSNINKDTIWGVGGLLYTPNGYRGILYRTTNGGINWQYQIPDTGFQIPQYWYIEFYNRLNGWSYSDYSRGIHTVTGGDSVFITNIIRGNESIVKEFQLNQNYPNPFNSITNIKFKLKSGMIFAEIKVYDITGKLIRVLTSKKYEAGEHTVRFDAAGLPSGVYFYKLGAGDFSQTRKMILLR